MIQPTLSVWELDEFERSEAAKYLTEDGPDPRGFIQRVTGRHASIELPAPSSPRDDGWSWAATHHDAFGNHGHVRRIVQHGGHLWCLGPSRIVRREADPD
jgi:hypothetical protein